MTENENINVIDKELSSNTESKVIQEQMNTVVVSNAITMKVSIEEQVKISATRPQSIRIAGKPANSENWPKEKNHKRSPKSRLGVRRVRRQDNLKCLLDLLDEDEELIYGQLIEPSTSPISELHCDVHKMEAWNTFIDSSETDQSKLLKEIDLQDTRIEDDDEGSACFRYHNIDRNIRTFLKKRKLPTGLMDTIEKDLSEFFTNDPKGVFIYNLKSSYERILTHTLSQYLRLKSHSYDNSEGARQTTVENMHEDFIRPPVTLVEYLHQKM